jgi:defect-in-organelle-trafficking protein DotB
MKKNNFVPILYNNESSTFTSYDLEKFLFWVVDNEVSDITIQNEEMVFCEIHGKKHKVSHKRLSKTDLMGIIAKIHSDGAISTLNSGEEIDYAYFVKRDKYTTCRFRVNMKSISILGDKGFSLSLRVINNIPPDIEILKLPGDMLQAFKSRKGLIAVAGPTGSGKTTLLASVIAWRLVAEDAHIKVSTYESPIEYTYEYLDTKTSSISQMEIKTNIGSFADGVRNSLRTRSDVVLVGEARDYDTISAAINAAMTGPLVYTTAHANNCSEMLARLINVFPDNERVPRLIDLVTNLKMLVTQNLVPSVDGKRIAVREYLIFNQEIVDLILEAEFDNITHTMRRIVKQYGKTFLEDLTEKYHQGLISQEVFDEYR